MYTNLTRCGLHPQLITFEAFEESQQLPPSFVRLLLPCEHKELEQQKYESVRIVHSRNISDFVENADEVYDHFIATPYPTFAEVFTKRVNVTAAEFADLVLA